MRVLLTGASGQLGLAFQRLLQGDPLRPLSHSELDVTDQSSVVRAVASFRPDCILNCAAYNLVDRSEQKPDLALRVNALGVLYLAQAAEETGAVLVHFSTDYVFDGSNRAPYVESDSPSPVNFYGASKLLGEWAARRYASRHFVIRTSGLFGPGSRTLGGNFVERILHAAREGKPLRIVKDQVLTPTSARELAEKTLMLLRKSRYGLYHMTNSGQCSWYEFAGEIFRLARLTPQLTPVTTQEFGAAARRPPYSVLENQACRTIGLPEFRPWQEALREYIEEQVT